MNIQLKFIFTPKFSQLKDLYLCKFLLSEAYNKIASVEPFGWLNAPFLADIKLCNLINS